MLVGKMGVNVNKYSVYDIKFSKKYLTIILGFYWKRKMLIFYITEIKMSDSNLKIKLSFLHEEIVSAANKKGSRISKYN